MAYIKETCKAGNTKEIRLYYTRKYGPKGKKRKNKEKKTTDAQAKVNTRNAEKKLTRIFNANFWKQYYITLDYRTECRPCDQEQMRKDMDKFLRKLREEYKKQGKVLKYVHVAEIGERGAMHHHLVINKIDTDILTELWEIKGWVTVKLMDSNGQYRKLAGYFIKYFEKTARTLGIKLQGKRWNPSRNLIHPVTAKEVVTNRAWYRREIKTPKGYYLDKDTVQEGIHEVTGYPYFSYTLIKLSQSGIKSKDDSFM